MYRIAASAVFLAVTIALLALAVARGQSVDDPVLRGQLKRVFPAAASFSAKTGNPPVFRAYAEAPSGQEPELLGFAFWTSIWHVYSCLMFMAKKGKSCRREIH